MSTLSANLFTMKIYQHSFSSKAFSKKKKPAENVSPTPTLAAIICKTKLAPVDNHIKYGELKLHSGSDAPAGKHLISTVAI